MDGVIEVKPVMDYTVRSLCKTPYPRHPKGCINWNHKEGCPPKCSFFDKEFDLSKLVYAIYNIFDYKSHIDNMKIKHPNWSNAQLKCVLYWQGKARKTLRSKIKEFLSQHRDYSICPCPEAFGVDVTKTMENIGIKLEWPPVNITYQIVLAGIKK